MIKNLEGLYEPGGRVSAWIKMKPIMDDPSGLNLSGTTVIRNEPFGGVSWAPSDNVVCS